MRAKRWQLSKFGKLTSDWYTREYYKAWISYKIRERIYRYQDIIPGLLALPGMFAGYYFGAKAASRIEEHPEGSLVVYALLRFFMPEYFGPSWKN